jgi:hypothetical protein
LDKLNDQLEAVNTRIALNVMPLLKECHYRLSAMVWLVWSQIAMLAIIIGLLAVVLVMAANG